MSARRERSSAVRSGKLATPPWLHLRERPEPSRRPVDVNVASAKELRELLGLSPTAAARLVRARAKRRLRDADDIATVAGLSPRALAKLRGRLVGAVRDQVVIFDATIERERIFSGRSWGIRVRFAPPSDGVVVVAALEVRWRGSPFVIQTEVGAEASARGELAIGVDESHSLDTGPVELWVTLYDSRGGATRRGLPTWVFPSNPFSLIVSPANRAIFNGSVRPDWQPPNWITALNLTFVNGDAVPVTLKRPMTWRFWDGGVNGTLIESGGFTWPSTIVVPAFGTYAGWFTVTSPPGSGIANLYERREDMTIQLVFEKVDSTAVDGRVTCRVMAGWGVNIILVGDYTASEQGTIASGASDAQSVYENFGLTFSSVQWWGISNAQAGGYTVLNDEDEWDDLIDDWTVPNDSVDCFIVRGLWNGFAGYSPQPGPASKDGWCTTDGLAVELSLQCLAHELGHYIGGRDHDPTAGNIMFATCGGRDLRYDQYRSYLGHGFTRVVR